MGLTTRTIASATDATNAWGSKVSQSSATWSKKYLNPRRDPFTAANVDPDAWQAGVTTDTAKQKYLAGMTSVDITALTATVNGPGAAKYAAAGTNKKAKYQTFATNFLPKLNNIVQSLPARGPRGSQQNKARVMQFFDQVAATRGTN